MLPMRYHLPLMVVCEFAGFFLGVIPVGVAWVSGWLGQQLWLASVALVAGGFVGVMLPRVVFRHLWPARCNQQGCRGRAFPEGADPITYVCRACGHMTETVVSEGGGHGQWHDR